MSGAPAAVGVHAALRSRLPDVLEGGLWRPSSGWFVVGRESCAEELRTTLAAAFHIALRIGDQLASVPRAGAYRRWFERHPGSLPGLALFALQASDEPLDRYRWLGPPRSGLTAPYTKVERARRVVDFGRGGVSIVQLGHDDVSRCEDTADARARPSAGWWAASRLVRRVALDGDAGGAAAGPVDTKLGWFCAALADAAYPRLYAQLRCLDGGGDTRPPGEER